MSETPGNAVFLSYASQDAEAARRICEVLRSAGIEVWFDQDELRGGDEWDAKIKRQIRECALFVPIISKTTQARTEGYFRREWNLATQRLLDMAPGRPFLLPVVIDDTSERNAVVQEEFLKVQWTRLPDGIVSPNTVARFQSLLESLARGTPGLLPRPGFPEAPTDAARTSPRRSVFTWLATCAVIAVIAGFALFDGRASPPKLRQLAILPFTAIGEAPGNQAFCDGLSETVSSQLTKLEQFQRTLLVVPNAEVRKEAISTPSQARALFGATVVLTGSVQRTETTVRVNVNLVDAGTLRIIRSGTFDQAPNELYRLQDQVAAQAAEWLGLELSEQSKRALASGQTTVASAFELYVRSRGELALYNGSGVDAAITYLHQALLSDPRYALAHAALGEAFWLKYLLTKERRWSEEARRSCLTALQYGATLATPHVTMANLLLGTGQYEQALAEAETALRLDSASGEATRVLARAYERLNRKAEAEATFKNAIERNPENPRAVADLGVMYWRTGRMEDAERMFLRVAELTPDNYSNYRNLGGLYVVMGRPEKAAQLLEKSIALKPSWSAYSNLGTLRFQQGRYADAAAHYERAIEINPREYLVRGNFADALRFIPARAGEASSAYGQAIKLAENGLLVNPKDAALHATLARYHAFTGNIPRALEGIKQARALGPQNMPVLFDAALVYEQTGDREGALAAVAAALKGGYSRTDILAHPDLKNLRADARFASLVSASPSPPP